jgi:hypothetical protein
MKESGYRDPNWYPASFIQNPAAIDGTIVRATFMAPTVRRWVGGRHECGVVPMGVGAINVARTVLPSMAAGCDPWRVAQSCG